MQSNNDFEKEALTCDGGSSEVRYRCAGASARGFARHENQDRYRIADTGVVLCDGIGGADAGEVFAEASCWSCGKLLGEELGADEILEDANGRISSIGRAIGGCGGSSVCLAKFCGDGSIDISSRGDVLAFRTDGRNIAAINTPDYSNSWRLEAFLGDGWEGHRKSQRYCAMPLEAPSECLILVSDGIWKCVAPEEMADVWRDADGDAGAAAEHLVSLAGRYGSLDDRTAIICRRVG